MLRLSGRHHEANLPCLGRLWPSGAAVLQGLRCRRRKAVACSTAGPWTLPGSRCSARPCGQVRTGRCWCSSSSKSQPLCLEKPVRDGLIDRGPQPFRLHRISEPYIDSNGYSCARPTRTWAARSAAAPGQVGEELQLQAMSPVGDRNDRWSEGQGQPGGTADGFVPITLEVHLAARSPCLPRADPQPFCTSPIPTPMAQLIAAAAPATRWQAAERPSTRSH